MVYGNLSRSGHNRLADGATDEEYNQRNVHLDRVDLADCVQTRHTTLIYKYITIEMYFNKIYEIHIFEMKEAFCLCWDAMVFG